MHHGGQFDNSRTFKYTGKKVDYFDFCHVKAMSMLEIMDMIKELGLSFDDTRCFWKCFGGALSHSSIRPLISDFDVLNLIATIPRNHNSHVYLVSTEVNGHGSPVNVSFESEVQNESQSREEAETVERSGIDPDFDAKTDGIPQTEAVRREKAQQYTGKEETDDENDLDSDVDFHQSDYDMEDDDNQAHEVHVDLGIEDDLGLRADRDYVSQEYGNESDNDANSDSLRSVHESDAEDVTQWPEFNSEVDMENP
ncbi:hypothetical protein PTKIN_Ptkin02bG0102200 [Pterospermum kingtungense]